MVFGHSISIFLAPFYSYCSCHRCQINTTPLKKQIGCIDVNCRLKIYINESETIQSSFQSRQFTLLHSCELMANIFSFSISVPPDILDTESSQDITVNEGQNASLHCRATGNPQPRNSTFFPHSPNFFLFPRLIHLIS